MAVARAGFDDAVGGPTGRDSLVRQGPTMFVIVSAVGPDKLSQTDGQLHAQAASQIPALIDTGATESCIDDALARNLGLPIVDKHVVAGVAGQHSVDVYLGYVFVPALNVVLTGLFCGVHLTSGGQVHQVLLGRTMLQNVVMIYDGVSGTVTLAN